MEIHLLNLSTLQRFLSSLQVKLRENGLFLAFKPVLFHPVMILINNLYDSVNSTVVVTVYVYTSYILKFMHY